MFHHAQWGSGRAHLTKYFFTAFQAAAFISWFATFHLDLQRSKAIQDQDSVTKPSSLNSGTVVYHSP
jgi:hypothetical protein